MSTGHHGNPQAPKIIWERGPFKCLEIYFGDKLYLRRWSLSLPFGFAVKLHKILLADRGDPHDHPWLFFVAVILRGAYRETYSNGHLDRRFTKADPDYTDRVQRVGSVTAHTILDRHRVFPLVSPTWTLGFYGPKPRGDNWGFFDHQYDRFIPHNEYESDRQL